MYKKYSQMASFSFEFFLKFVAFFLNKKQQKLGKIKQAESEMIYIFIVQS